MRTRAYRIGKSSLVSAAGLLRGLNPPPSCYRIEFLEPRLLLSNYSLSQLGLFGNNAVGAQPQSGLVRDANGNLYGTTYSGGADVVGTIFEIASGTSSATALASFDGPNGAYPRDELVLDGSGNLFGIAQAGGTYDWGCVFELPHGSSTILPLASFDKVNGLSPEGPLALDADGNLYGTTEGGGPSNHGTVFEFRRGSDTLNTLVSFSGTNGMAPWGGVVFDAQGDLYGTTAEGGANGSGEVFEIPRGSTGITIVSSFNGGNGAGPRGVIIDGLGNLYGATGSGGANGDGTIFEVPAGTTSITTLTALSAPGDIVEAPLILDGGGNLYGTISPGGGSTDNGTIFELPKGEAAITTLASFGGSSGRAPEGSLLRDPAGNLYGTTVDGGVDNFGTVFELASGASKLTTLFSFPFLGASESQGTVAPAGLLTDPAGNLYGTTSAGGLGNDGAIFEITAGSSFIQTLASFDGSDGIAPCGSLVLDAAGDLFGTAASGGAHNSGTVYELPHGSSAISVLASFDGTDGISPNGCTADAAGNLYGTTFRGGTANAGTVFELQHGSSTITTLAGFSSSPSSQNPVSGLVFDSAGNAFGVTCTIDAPIQSSVFELPSGTSVIRTLASFPYGTRVGSGLVIDSNGNLIGESYVSPSGTDPSTHASIFSVAPGNSAPTTLASFSMSDATPVGNLSLDSSGNLFGTASLFTSTPSGIAFELARGSSALTVVASLAGTLYGLGAPESGLITDGKGNLYGTSSGVITGDGKLFELSPVQLKDSIAPAGNGLDIRLTEDYGGQLIDCAVGSSVSYCVINDPAGLTIDDGANNDAITLDYLNGDPLPNTLHLNGLFTIDGLSGSSPFAGTTLDLSSGSTTYLAYASAASDPLASVKTDLQTGYNSGTWTGTATSTVGVITSADAAANPIHLAVGYADSADPNSPDKIANTVELKTTVVGDTNLDGSVNLFDLLTLTRNFGKGSNWDQADFNYDSSVTLSDFLALTRNFGKTLVANPLIVTSTADDGSLGTLRYAIAHSNPGDTITFDPTLFAPGTSHTLTLNGSQLEVTHNLTIQGPGSANLSISGNNASRIFQIDPSVTATLSGLTLTSGNAAAAYGGAINNAGTLNLSNCSITSSTAKDGGGLYSISGSANVTNCTFSNDTASAYGGALFNDAQATSTVTGCTFLSNSAGHGGALLDYGTALVLINDTITQNTSTGSGGGINNVAGNLVVTNCTIVNNTTGSAGGGIYNGQTATLNNSIVAQNTTTSAAPSDLAGNSFSGSNNLIADGSGGLSSSNHNLLGSPSSLLNPKLGSLSNNGGPTLTFMPLSGSPVIDAGSNSPIPTGISTDQRGYGRIFNGTVDIGAVEFGSALAPAISSGSQQPASTTTRRRV